MIVRKNGIAELDARLDMIEGIDEEIIYRDSTNMGSPYTYIIKILGLNKDRYAATSVVFLARIVLCVCDCSIPVRDPESM